MKTTPLPSTNQDIKFIDIKNHLNYFLKSIKKFKTYNTVYREEISEILHSISPILISPKEQEKLQLKIDTNQNLFNKFYSQFSFLKEHSFEEKVGLTTEKFLEYLSCTKYEGLYTSKLKVKFKSDLIEFLKLNKQFKHEKIEKIEKVENSKFKLNELKKLFEDEKKFEKLNLHDLKENDIIFDSKVSEFVFNNRFIPDLVILISYLHSKDLIKLDTGIKYLSQVSSIIKEFSNQNYDPGRISRIFNGVVNKKYLSSNDLKTLNKLTQILINSEIVDS